MLLHHVKLSTVAAAAVAVVLLFVPGFAMFAAAIAFIAVAVALATWIDRRFMPGYDTFDLRKDAPHDTMAAAVIWLGVCVLIGAALLASGGAFARFGG
jgi:hypothetical protein